MRNKLIICLILFSFSFYSKAQVEPLLLYKAMQEPECEKWVDAQMAKMSLKEKVGQLFIYTIAPVSTKNNLNLLKDVVKTYKVGALLFSGGLAQNQALLTNYAQTYAKVPLMITFDGEWGLAMRLRGTPAFPKNMILGCIQDDKLIYEYGKEMARECRELGIHVNFAPVADVNVNPNNPVINSRSFGANPCNVADKVVAYASGLESGRVLSVAKHFPGHGDTDTDSHLTLPVLPFTRERLDSVELYPFKEYIRAGLGGIMVGHLQVPILEPDLRLPSSLSRNVVYDLLREELKFKGLVFTDALAMKGVAGSENVCALALRAGNDMVLTPRNIKEEIQGVIDAVKKGDLTEESIERKCRKVLLYKYALGIRENKKIRLSGLDKRINTSAAEDLIRQLRIAAITVLKNKKHLLPLSESNSEIAVVSIGKVQSDSAFVTGLKSYTTVHHFHLDKKMKEKEVKDIKKRLAHYKRVIVSVTSSDVKGYEKILSTLSMTVPTIYIFFTSHDVIAKLPLAVSASFSVILGHSAEREIQMHIADILFGKTSVNGRLSANIGNLFHTGEGVTITPATPHYYSPEDYGLRSDILGRIDSIVNEGIHAGAFPGCQVVVLKEGKPVYNKCFGNHTYKDNREVRFTDMYDLASLSKTTGTLLAVMKLYDKGLFNLTDKISDYLPFLKEGNKANITIAELLFHQSGLPASIPFYKDAIDDKSYKGTFFKNKKDPAHKTQVDANLYANSTFSYKKGLVSSTSSSNYTIHVADSFWLNKSFHDIVMQKIANTPLKEKKYLYSCINFILLKELIEGVSGQNMDDLLKREYYIPMGLDRLDYLPLRNFDKDDIVPTVENDFLRKGELRGYVHDEAAAFLGGISGNAGLFGTAHEVAAVYQMLLNEGEYEGRRYLSEETCRLFTTSISKMSRRGLGFDKPDSKNLKNSPCSASTSASVYGHTGFTGTCAWADPDNNLVYVFLSNRTYPEPWNKKLNKLNIRTRIQETIYESMKNYSK